MTEEVVETLAEVPAPELETTAEPVLEDKPVKTFTQEELDSIVTKRLAKESRKLTRQAELEVENRYLREQASKREVKAEPAAPTQGEYSTYEEYLEAKAEYIAEKKVESKMAERDKQEAQSKFDADRTKVVSTWQQKVEVATAKYADYNEVLESVDHIEIPPALQNAIMESDVGSDLAYHLGKNPAELERIVALKPYAALMELGKIAAKVSQPAEVQKKQPSKAPEPIKPLSGKATADTVAHSPNDDFKTFLRKRNAELGRIK